MAVLSNKQMERSTKIRLILVGIIVLVDIVFLPWLLKFPFFVIESFTTAPAAWFEYGILNSIKEVFENANFRKLYLFMQLPVMTLIIGVAWNVDRLKKRNRIADGVGGPEPAGTGQHGTSRWQNRKEMDETAVVWDSDTEIKKGGIIFGMEKSKKGQEKVWLTNDDLHTLIIGATRSGKSRKLILPSIWELAKAGESMVIGDPKGELYIYTKEYLESQGYNVISLNLREPLKGNQWNILDIVNKAIDEGNVPRASELAWDIANTITNQAPATSSEPIWKNGEESTIASLILLSVMNSDFKFQRHMTTAYYLLAEYGQPLDDDTIPLLDFIKSLPVRHPAKSAFATASIAPYKTRASFFTTALSDLRLFSDPNIADMTSKQDHDIESIGIEKTAVFLIVPDEKSTRNVLATLYIDQVYQSMVDLANKRGGRIPRRVNFILDEFGNLPPIPDFDKKLTVAGGRGVRFTLAVQDIAQIKKLYNKNAQTITGNCHNWIYLKTADIETAKLISEKTGKYTVETENSSSSVQSRGHSLTHGIGLTGRPLLLPDEVLRWNIDESLVLPISYFPARYPLPDLSLWKANEDFGFVATGNIEQDKEINRQIVEKRWQDLYARKIEEISVWLPEIEIEDHEEGEEEGPDLINAPKEVAAAVNEVAEENGGVDVQPVNMAEYNLDSIIKTSNNEPVAEDEEDFL